MHHHKDLFHRSDDGIYYDAYLNQTSGNVSTGYLVWVFSDSRFKKIYDAVQRDELTDAQYKFITGYLPSGNIIDIINDVIERVETKGEIIEDHSEKRYVVDDDGTEAKFDFMVLDSDNGGYQDYFCFKITYFRDVSVDEDAVLEMNAEIPSQLVDSYQWAYEDENGKFVDIEGANESKYSPGTMDSDDNGRKYRCTVIEKSNRKLNYQSENIFTVVVNKKDEPDGPEPPKPNTPPTVSPTGTKSVIFVKGDEVTLNVTGADADGDTLVYTWYEKDSDKPLGSGSSLKIDTGDGEYDGKVYYCEVSDDKENTTPARSAEFTLKELTVAWDGAASAEVNSGESVELKVTAKNAKTYTWYRVGESNTPLGTTSEPVFTLNNVTDQMDGSRYLCTVEDETGDKQATTKVPFVLTVKAKEEEPDEPPAYVKPDSQQTVLFTPGEEVSLTMTLNPEDKPPKAFAWYIEDEDGSQELIDGPDSNRFTITSCPADADGSKFTCVAEYEDGSTQSAGFLLKKRVVKPEITSPQEPTERAFLAGETITLSVEAKNAERYQWFVDEGDGGLKPVEGATQSSMTIDTAEGNKDGFVYVCRAYNGNEQDESPAFILSLVKMAQMPETGDSSALLAWACVLLSAVCGFAAMAKRKRSAR